MKEKNFKVRIIKMMSIVILVIFLSVSLSVAGNEIVLFSPYVDSTGNITLPSDYNSTWIHLGTWVVTSQVAAGINLGRTAPASGLHEVYSQPGSFEAYKKDGKWPDSTVIIKEIHPLKWDDMPTGHVIYGDEITSWFVMIKDSKGRFTNNPNWGDGWGWALFKAGAPKNISTNYKNDCLGCHEQARSSDLIFTHGYPILR